MGLIQRPWKLCIKKVTALKMKAADANKAGMPVVYGPAACPGGRNSRFWAGRGRIVEK
jgi:hypothetical protein